MKNIAIFAGLNLIALSAILQPSATAPVAGTELLADAIISRTRREEPVKSATFIELILGIFDTLQLGRRNWVSKTH